MSVQAQEVVGGRPGGREVAAKDSRDSRDSRWRRFAGTAVDLVRRYPATAALLFVAFAVGAATGALWSDVSTNQDLYDSVAYGLEPLREGRWWTFFTGAFFVPELVLYVPVLGLLVAAASTFERRVGHWQTLVVVVGGQAAGAILTALFLWPFRDSGWSWAVELGQKVDVGISAGGFAVLGALTAVMQPVWRTRVRAGVTAYLIAMLLQSGLLWDVEHFLAWTLGMVLGPLFVGRLPRIPEVGFSPRTQRAVVALVIAVQAIAVMVEAMFPGNGGPFWSGEERYHSSGVTLALVVGSLVFLLAADTLRRGRRIAWVFVTALLALTFLGLFGTEATAERAADLVLVGAQLVMLVLTYRAFDVRTRRRALHRAGRRLVVVVLALFAYTAIGFWVLKDDFVPAADFADMVGEFVSRLFFVRNDNIEPATEAARWFRRSIGMIWITALLASLLGLVYSSRRPKQKPEAEAELRDLLRTYNTSSIEWMLTWDGNTVWRNKADDTVIGYRVVGSVALALADPVGPPESRLEAMREFDDFCFHQGWIPCLFAAGEETAKLAPQVRWKAIQVAEDSVVPLADLEFKGKSWQDVRTAMNRAGKEDIRLEVTRWADATPVVTDQLRSISSGWVADKDLPEMGFTLGGIAEAEDPEVRLHLAMRKDGTIEGFTSWMPVYEDGKVVGWTVDLMRRRDEGFRPVMEFLIGASALKFKEERYRFISLSAAPLAKAPERLGANSDEQVLQKLLDFLGDSLEPYYGFRSLLAFKAKFQPVFYPMYLVFPDESALAEIGIAIARAYMPDATTVDWAKMSWDMVKP